jgi:geranylgeranyl diphosphate synthase type II
MGKVLNQVAFGTEIPTDFGVGERIAGLRADRAKVEAYLAEILSVSEQPAFNPVPRAMEYAAMGNAQRVRPILALRVARMLRAETAIALRAACSVELLHSASLVVDDLPCMDNEMIRRGRTALHIQFGESTAILAAFSMVALAARIAMESPGVEVENPRLRLFQYSLLRTLDCSSLVGGQSMDLALVGAERDKMRTTVNELKTVPLFQLAVEAGCVSYPGGVPKELDVFGRLFGVAYQLTDDFLDGEFQDRKILDDTYEQCRACLQSFGANAEPLLELVDHLAQRAAA